MQGICGVVDLRDAADLGDALGRMILSLGTAGATLPVTLRREFGHVALGGASCREGAVGVAVQSRGADSVAAIVSGLLTTEVDGSRFLEGSEAAARVLGRFAAVGLRALLEIRGEYCLAIWDGSSDSLHVATDPFRTLPVFYAVSADRLLFASTVRALRGVPGQSSARYDPWSIVDVVASSIIPAPRTIFQDIRKLPAAHRLTMRAGRCEVVPYWNFDFLHPSDASYAALATRLRTVLRESVTARLETDTTASRRVGTFLSGGVDSSTVTALVGSITGAPAECFTIGFEETAFDEMNYARIAASAVGAKHHERIVTAGDVSAILPVLVDTFDEPFANASAIPAYYCARFARERGIDVLYAGDGGDELFAGNQRYLSRRVFDNYRSLPSWFRRFLLEPAFSGLGGRVRSPLLARVNRFIQRANASHFDQMTAHHLLRLHPVSELFRDGFLDSLGADFEAYRTDRLHYEGAPARSPLDRELYLDLKMTISDNDVIKVSRACDAAGIEVRYPFLDRVVAEFATTVPASLKVRGGRLRWFFKEAYSDVLPHAVRAKRKHGFGLPIPIWLRTDPALRSMVRDLLLGPECMAADYLRPSALRDLVARHEQDTTSFYGTILWNVVVLELFLRSQSRRLARP